MDFIKTYQEDIVEFFKAFIDLIKAIFGLDKEEEETPEAEG